MSDQYTPPAYNSKKPWTKAADAFLLVSYKAGISLADLALEFSRTAGAIEARLIRLGAWPAPSYKETSV